MKIQNKFIILYLTQSISLSCSTIAALIGLSIFGDEKNDTQEVYKLDEKQK